MIAYSREIIYGVIGKMVHNGAGEVRQIQKAECQAVSICGSQQGPAVGAGTSVNILNFYGLPDIFLRELRQNPRGIVCA